MKAMVLREHGGLANVRLETDFPDPQAGPGDVVLRVKATSLNYHDIFTRRGMPGIKVPMPAIMGLDVAGEIVTLGPGVSDWAIGDRVSVDPGRGRTDRRDRPWRTRRVVPGARPPADPHSRGGEL